MKKFIFIILFLNQFLGNSQELMNFYLSENTLSSDSSLMLHTTFFSYYGAGITGYNYEIKGDEIFFSLCYALSSTTESTLDQKAFEISLPSNIGEYSLHINLNSYTEGIDCENSNLLKSYVINFSAPFNETEKIEINDTVFENYLENLDFGDGIQDNNLVFKNRIENISLLFLNDYGILPLNGIIENLDSIHYFKSLTDLWFQNNLVSHIDLSFNENLKILKCYGNLIENLDVSHNPMLSWLEANNNPLINLNVNNCPSLEYLSFSGENLNNINLNSNSNLKYLEIDTTSINNIDLSQNLLLEEFKIKNSSLTSLNLSNNILLKKIILRENEDLGFLNIDNLTDIEYITCIYNNLKNLDLSFNPNLKEVFLYNNNLNTLNIKNGNNQYVEYLITINNPNLFCIEVDDEVEADTYDWIVGSQTEFSEDCENSNNPNESFIGDSTFIFTIYPNPVNNILFIKSQSTQIKDLKIFDIQGNIMIETTSTNQIDVSKLKPGVYFIYINGSYYINKFIKS